jgi:dipeptide/tripeptide permease
LILIPISFIFSQILIFLFGISVIGEEILSILGIPMIFGLFVAIILSYLLFQRTAIRKFSQIENIFRILTIIGGGVLIILICFQIILDIKSLDIIPFMALVISTIGDMMTIMCIYLLRNSFVKKESLK